MGVVDVLEQELDVPGRYVERLREFPTRARPRSPPAFFEVEDGVYRSPCQTSQIPLRKGILFT